MSVLKRMNWCWTEGLWCRLRTHLGTLLGPMFLPFNIVQYQLFERKFRIFIEQKFFFTFHMNAYDAGTMMLTVSGEMGLRNSTESSTLTKVLIS